MHFHILNKSYNHDIPTIFTKPNTLNEKYPLVILCHGTGSNKDEVGNLFVDLTKRLADEGIASVRFDFIGTGESKVDYIHYSLSSAQSDVKSVLEHCKSLKNVDLTNIAILGFSQGGTIAMLSNGNLKEYKALVSWSGAVQLNGMANPNQVKEAKEKGYTKFEFDFRPPLNLSKQWIEEVEITDVLDVFSNYPLPTLAIGGMDDVLVPYENVSKIVQASSHPKSKAILYKETDHIFNVLSINSRKDNLILETVNWLKGIFDDD